MADEHRISRRTFITSGAAVAVGGVTAASLVTGVTPAGLISALFSDTAVVLRRSTFTPHVGENFTMAGSGGTATVVLSSIGDLEPVNMPNDEDRFSLLFHAPLNEDLDQGVYTFSNSSLGQVVLLAVPVDQVQANRHYEVVVNRSNFTNGTTTTTTPPTTTPPTTEPPTTEPPTTEPPTTEPPTTEPPRGTTTSTEPPPTTTTSPPR